MGKTIIKISVAILFAGILGAVSTSAMAEEIGSGTATTTSTTTTTSTNTTFWDWLLTQIGG